MVFWHLFGLFFPEKSLSAIIKGGLETKTKLYRVHKSVLSSQPLVFKDLFELPVAHLRSEKEKETQDLGDTYDGVPVVKMVGDKDDHVEVLVRALYQPYELCVLQLLSLRLEEQITNLDQ